MSKQEPQPQRRYKNIYLFSSLKNYGEKTIDKLNTLNFNVNDDCIALFNFPNEYTQRLLKNSQINYFFCRAFKPHRSKTIDIIKKNIFDMRDVEIIHEELDNETDSFFTQFKNFNLRKNNIYINNINFCHEYFCKNLGYVPDKPGHYSPSMGFKSIIMLNLLYPDAKFYLIGFEHMKNKNIQGHNLKFENEYLEKNNIQHLYL